MTQMAEVAGRGRKRPVWATVLAICLVVVALVYIGLFGIYGAAFKSGRVHVVVPLWSTLITALPSLVLAWAFWARKWWSGRALTILFWAAILGNFAFFIFHSKPTPDEVWRVSLWWFLPPTVLAIFLTVFLARKRDVFEEWAGK